MAGAVPDLLTLQPVAPHPILTFVMMDWMTLQTLAVLLEAAILGGMLFFAFVTAPVIFTSLEAPVAAGLIRKMFPAYYLYMGVLSALTTILLSFVDEIDAVAMSGVALLFWIARQVLMPHINSLRDREQEGDEAAGRRFKAMHRLSVIINLVQMVAVAVLLVRTI
jgi:hypothetical protein